MTITFTKGATVITPLIRLEYEFDREYNNMVTPVIGAASDVAFEPAEMRAGTLSVLCTGLTQAMALDTLHNSTGTVAFADSTVAALNMTYVPNGGSRISIDPETRELWIFSIDFQETT